MNECHLRRPRTESMLVEVSRNEDLSFSRLADKTALSCIPNDGEKKSYKRSRKIAIRNPPCCQASRLAARLASLLSSLHWNQMWIGLVPARIGCYPSVDLAALALVELYNSKRNDCMIARDNFLRQYVKAMTAVRVLTDEASSWRPGEVQVTVAILSSIESAQGTSMKSIFTHKQGLFTLLARSSCATEMMRAVLYDDAVATYLIACVRGEASGFDKDFFFDLEPTSRQAPTDAVAKLKKTSYRLRLRLPRLISLVRRLRADTTDMAIMREALAVARELLVWRDEDAESRLLHTVRIIPPSQKENRYFVPVGLRFDDLAEFQAAVSYWQALITLNCLCARLQHSFTDGELFDNEHLSKENCRMAKNLLMIWESTFDRSAYGISRGGVGIISFAMSMVSVWGVLRDVSVFQGHESEKVRRSLLEWCRMSKCFGVEEIEAVQMDEMAEMFAGGPIQGVMPMLVFGRTMTRN